MGTIFDRIRLRPTQLRTVADRRLGDAQCLCDSNNNERANGAIYLAGFVVECLLKARLLEKFRWLQGAHSPERLSTNQQRIWSLFYRSHDLDEILVHVPEVLHSIARFEQQENGPLAQRLKAICDEWTIFARYSPKSLDIGKARLFVAHIRRLKPCLQ